MRYFLELCLFSVQKAIKRSGLLAEVIVVDNHSIDRAIEYLKPKFPSVCFIYNKENLGFASACNQGFRNSTGTRILFLNPDTIIAEDCLEKCFAFLDERLETGVLGIRMLDGGGKFLKESKRAFPSPLTSLFKLFGLSKLFPHSKLFSRYHLGHLNENENHEVDVLAGAFMIVPRPIFEQAGGFDEIFFMYGEDIDLSYRIQRIGFRNFYFAETSLIHFKGESTRKGSLNYVKMFYKAMSLFVRKHYGGTKARVFNFLIQSGIWTRAAISAIGRFIQWIGLPVLDAGLILFSLWLVKNLWNQYIKTDVVYENWLLWIAFPLFTTFFLLVAWYAGLYDRWYRHGQVLRSTVIATIVLLAIYSLFPERYRFSRGIIFFGAFLAFVLISILRIFLIRWNILHFSHNEISHPRTLIIASKSEYERVLEVLYKARLENRVLGRVPIDQDDTEGIGSWKNLHLLFSAIPFDELIFCEGTLHFKDIIETIEKVPKNIRVKFYASGSESIVGSESKDTVGESLSKENSYKLADPYFKRIKRLFDFVLSFFLLITFPIHLIILRRPGPFFRNCFSVVLAKKTWIGYCRNTEELPELPDGIMSCNGYSTGLQNNLPAESQQVLDQWYARNYKPVNDLKLVWKHYKNLGM